MKDLKNQDVKSGDILFYSEIMEVDDDSINYDLVSDDGSKWNFIYADSIEKVIEIDEVLHTVSIVIRNTNNDFMSFKGDIPMKLDVGSWDSGCNPTSNLNDSFVIDKQENYLNYITDNIDSLHKEMMTLKKDKK